jgi:hypothetical protein
MQIPASNPTQLDLEDIRLMVNIFAASAFLISAMIGLCAAYLHKVAKELRKIREHLTKA